ESQLYRLAGSARRRNDDQPARWRLGGDEGRMVRREVSVGYGALHPLWKVHTSHPMRNGPGDSASSGAVAMTSRDLVSAFPSFTPTVRLLFRILVAIVVARAVTGIVIVTSVVVAGVAAVVALVVAAVLPAAAATTVLALVVV